MNRHSRTIVIITLLALFAAWLIGTASWAADSPISPLPPPTEPPTATATMTPTPTTTPTPWLALLPYCGRADVYATARATPGPVKD